VYKKTDCIKSILEFVLMTNINEYRDEMTSTFSYYR